MVGVLGIALAMEYPYLPEAPQMSLITSTLFWDRKVRIAILVLATFAALC